MDARDLLAQNLQALMDYHRDRGKPELATPKGIDSHFRERGKPIVSRMTISRALAADRSTGIDKLEAIARIFDVQAWQLLVPEMDPGNMPVVRVTEEEKRFWARLRFVQGEQGKVAVDESDAGNTRTGSHSARPGRGKVRK